MPTERERTLAAQLSLALGNIPVDPQYGDSTLTKELFLVDVTGNAEMRIGRAAGTVAVSAEVVQAALDKAQYFQPLFHRVVGELQPDTETKSGLLYTPTQLHPEFKRLRVTAVGLGTPEIPMPVAVGDLVVVPTESIQTVLGWTVINALDIVGVFKP